MNILFVATELAPHAKVGGLADVMAALPVALAKAGHGVSLAVPLHRGLRLSGEFRKTKRELNVPSAGRLWGTRVWEGRRGGVSLFGIERDEYFDRAHPYGEGGTEYKDNLARFNFLARAAVELARYIEPTPEVIQANDWHAALVSAHVLAMGLPIRTVFTIHNLRYQGEFAAEEFGSLGLPPGMFRMEGLEFYGKLNCMKGAVKMADAVTTVSPTYAQEIQTETQGAGLHEVLRSRGEHLTGILNGIDEEAWDPARDLELKANFQVGSMVGWEACRLGLEQEMGLESANGRPIFGMVTRMAQEKGVDLALSVAARIVEKGGRLVVLGTGESELEKEARRMAEQYPKQVVVRLEHHEGLARRIFAGSDFFLMPSRSEPCGLTQMYAMRYGSIPVVSDTGGLHDTVEEWDPTKKTGTGFRFSSITPAGLEGGIDRAMELWNEPAMMKLARRNGMSRDWGWGTAVSAYEKVYRSVLL